MSVRSLVRLILTNAAIFVALLVVVEGASSLARRTRTLFREPVYVPPEPFIRHDPDLGWSLLPGAVITGAGGVAPLHINSKGFRATRETGDVPPGKIRVVCSGDSYTFGDGAADQATWCSQLASLDPRLDTVNLGVPGYGADQAYLRYRRDGADLHEQIHLYAFIDDDLRRFGVRGIKPYLTAAHGRLTVHNVPVPPFARPTRFGDAFDELNVVQAAGSIGARLRGAWGRPVDGPADGVMDAMLDALAALGRERHSLPIVVRLPSPYAPSPYAAAFLAAARRSMLVVDLRERFDALPETAAWALFFEGRDPGAHFNDAGHLWVARELLPSVEEALKKEKAVAHATAFSHE